MQRDLEAYLWDIIRASELAREFCTGKSLEEFQVSDLLQSAVERKFEVIGEALRQIEQYFPGATAGLPDVHLSVGVRNRLAHGYFHIDQATLWRAVLNDLPRLEAAVRARVGEIPDEPPL